MKKVIIGIIIAIAIIIVGYLGFSLYFMNHFFFGSTINNISVSGRTVESGTKLVEEKINDYKLEIKGRNGVSGYVDTQDLGVKYNVSAEATELKNKQNPFLWVSQIFNNNYKKIDITQTYNKELLNKSLNKIFDFDSEQAPKNAGFKYENGKYVIIDSVEGDKVDVSKLDTIILQAVENDKKEVNVESLGCYEKPTYLKDSTKTIEAQKTLDKYVSTKVTYVFGDNTVVLDGDTINEWLYVDKDMNVHINTDKVTAYVQGLAKEYDTVGIQRTFKTSLGTMATVKGGDFGWKINVQAETEKLISNIENGQTVTREPVYSQKGLPYGTVGLGNTYVEVNIPKQKLWYYKDGKLIIESDVVTGNVSKHDGTPDGVYYVKYKEHDTHLKGANYDVPVKYWMPFNGGIGLHDAWWRNGKFGGNIYKTDGSHGCVNLPPKTAETIYNNITPGTIVVCYS
ncbi:MAG: L,D-transpeptidase family protein [Clostridium sp.]|uniref:L,D-transpeptidase family protein n=1 Tax=Clostridium sp. TaxID=1506 RepID=UPI003EE6C26E